MLIVAVQNGNLITGQKKGDLIRMLKQLTEPENCPWHKGKEGNVYARNQVFNWECPIMVHTLYPYFLGYIYGARYNFNERGDCQVCCPAEHSVDVIVKKRPYDERMKGIVPEDWRDVIHAEVVKINGECPYNYKVGDLIYFPTFARNRKLCPAALNNAILFMDVFNSGYYPCINRAKLRCPDWNENLYFEIT